jgi:hypothetical protein
MRGLVRNNHDKDGPSANQVPYMHSVLAITPIMPITFPNPGYPSRIPGTTSSVLRNAEDDARVPQMFHAASSPASAASSPIDSPSSRREGQ